MGPFIAAGWVHHSSVGATTSLNTGFLIGTDYVVAGAKGFALPRVMIKIKDTTGFCFEILIPGPNPTTVTPWADRIGAEPAPYGSSADGGHNAAFDGLPCDFITGKARERKSQILGQLTCQGFDLYHDFRGGKERGRPCRGRSWRPAKRCSKKRFLHFETI